MKVCLTHFPTFTDKSIPLGLACINGAMRSAGHETAVFDFDLGLHTEDPQLYYQIHHYAWQGDRHVVNFLGGADTELVLCSLFQDSAFLQREARERPERYRFLQRLQQFVDQAVARMLAHEPDEIWCSAYVSNFWVTMMAMRAIRDRAPRVGIGIGGPSIFNEPARNFVLLNGLADHCFVGEAEPIVIDYAEQCAPVAGMAWCQDGAVQFEPRRLQRRLETLPPPDFNGFPFPGQDIRAYLAREFNGIPVFFSRGCVQRCAFCAERNIWQRFRVKTPQAIVEELCYYRDNYGISLFYNCDSLVNFTAKWLEELCDAIIDAGLDCSFSFAFAIGKRLPRSLADKMVQAGFSRIFIGAEHASQPMLDRMNKGTVAEEVIQVTTDAVAAGLSVQLGTIVNFPGETTQDVLDEIRVFKQIDDTLMARGVPPEQLPQRSLANRFRLDPGTPMLAAPEQHGVALSPLPNPLPQALPGLTDVLLRWDYVESQDVDFHYYLASKFGNLPERWAVARPLAERMARGLQSFISDDDEIALSPWAEITRPEVQERALRVDGRMLPLSEKLYRIVQVATSGLPLGAVPQAVADRYRVAPATLRKLVALLFLERAIVFRRVAPLAHQPRPRPAPEPAASQPAAVHRMTPVRSQSPEAGAAWSRARPSRPAGLIASTGGIKS